MEAITLSVQCVAWCTWIGFTAAMRFYFQGARKRNWPKAFLTLSAAVCTLAQLALLFVGRAPSAWALCAGLGCFAMANVVFWSALWVHGSKRPAFAFLDVKPSALTQAGPYRVIRHPIYSAYLLGWLAGPFLTGEPWLFATLAWMGLLYYVAARQEEKHFAQTPFALEYEQYKRRTGMFLPRFSASLRPMPESQGRRAA